MENIITAILIGSKNSLYHVPYYISIQLLKLVIVYTSENEGVIYI